MDKVGPLFSVHLLQLYVILLPYCAFLESMFGPFMLRCSSEHVWRFFSFFLFLCMHVSVSFTYFLRVEQSGSKDMFLKELSWSSSIKQSLHLFCCSIVLFHFHLSLSCMLVYPGCTSFCLRCLLIQPYLPIRKRKVLACWLIVSWHLLCILLVEDTFCCLVLMQAIDRFRGNEHGILVATDVAARGLDIPGVRTVVHYQLPHSAEVSQHSQDFLPREFVKVLMVFCLFFMVGLCP